MWFVTINGNLWVCQNAEMALALISRATYYKNQEALHNPFVRNLRVTLQRKAA